MMISDTCDFIFKQLKYICLCILEHNLSSNAHVSSLRSSEIVTNIMLDNYNKIIIRDEFVKSYNKHFFRIAYLTLNFWTAREPIMQ